MGLWTPQSRDYNYVSSLLMHMSKTYRRVQTYTFPCIFSYLLLSKGFKTVLKSGEGEMSYVKGKRQEEES